MNFLPLFDVIELDSLVVSVYNWNIWFLSSRIMDYIDAFSFEIEIVAEVFGKIFLFINKSAGLYCCYLFNCVYFWALLLYRGNVIHIQIWHPYLRRRSKIAKYIVQSKGTLTKCLILNSKQFALFSFNLIVSRWYLKERFSSKKRPKYFVLLSIFIFYPLFLKFIFLIFLVFFT